MAAKRQPPPSVRQLARALLAEIVESYRDDGSEPRAVSALDLQRLDDVARAFDTLCIGTLQCLGEGLIWETRSLLLGRFGDQTAGPVYDCGSFFAMWEASLKAMADEAVQGWLGTTLKRCFGTRLDRFFEAVARHLETAAAADPERIGLIIEALRAPDRRHAGKQLLEALGISVSQRIAMLALGPASAPARARAKTSAIARDQTLAAAVKHAFHLLPQERQFDFNRMEESAENARRLALQAGQAARALLGDPEREDSGMVIAARSLPPVDEGWPRWSGVSVYRPPSSMI